MLYKNILKELPPTQLDKMKMGKRSYLAVSRIEKTKKCGRILVVDIYKRVKPRELQFRFFTDGKTFQVYSVENEKWAQKTLYSIISGRSDYCYGYVPEEYKIASSENTINEVKKIIGIDNCAEDSIIRLVDDFVRGITRERRQRANDAKEERIRRHMDLFGEYPSGFNDYLRTELFGEYIFVDKKIKGIKPGVCTACGKKIKFSEPVKHRSIIKCPKCGKQTVVFEKRYIDSIRERRRVCIADRKDGHLLFRWLDVSCGWYIADNGKYKPYYNKADYARTLQIYEQGKEKTVCYEYKYAYPWGAKWRKQDLSCDDLAYFYNRNLTKVFGNKYYNVDLEKELQENHQPLHVIKMLKNLKELPPTEYLFKMGMYRLASELDPETLGNGRDFASILGVSAQYKKMYAERNVSNDEHYIIKAAREWVSDEDFVKLRNLRPNSAQSTTICIMLETMTFKKFVNYFTAQRKLYPREGLDQVLRWYNDYISMSEQMNVDLSHKSVRYPKDIKTAHNELLKKHKAIEDEALERQMKKATENLYNGLTEYKDKDYAIVFPHSRAEFIAEGQSLNHCVGTQEMYFKNHLAGTKMIFFVRRAADIQKPYVTMEIDMKRLVIMQIYGYGDKRPDVQTIKFANKFLNLLKKDVTARRAC